MCISTLALDIRILRYLFNIYIYIIFVEENLIYLVLFKNVLYWNRLGLINNRV